MGCKNLKELKCVKINISKIILPIRISYKKNKLIKESYNNKIKYEISKKFRKIRNGISAFSILAEAKKH